MPNGEWLWKVEGFEMDVARKSESVTRLSLAIIMSFSLTAVAAAMTLDNPAQSGWATAESM